MRSSPLPAALLSLTLMCSLPMAGAQTAGGNAAQPAVASSRLIGTVTAITNGSITVRTADGHESTVAITPETRLLRAEPGAKTLKDAAPMTAAELAAGDRVLIRLNAAAGGPATAALLVAMKQADIAHQHAEQAEAWERQGVSGIVAHVDPATGSILLRPTGSQPPITISTTSSTVIRRYAPASTAFADARPGTMADIHPGDQLRARGTHSGNTVVADELVTGSFRDVAGTVLSTDPSAGTVTLSDLATKKPVTLRVNAETQLRELPPGLAEGLARHAHAGTASHASGNGAWQGAEHASGASPAGAHEHGLAGEGRDMQELLQRAPSMQLTQLKKGDAVLVVASGPGAPQPTAITVIAGVAPLLQAPPEASNEVFSASWNLGGGSEAAAGAEDVPQR